MVKFKIVCDPTITEKVRLDLVKNKKDLKILSRNWGRGKMLNKALKLARMPPLMASLTYKQHDDTFYCEMLVTGAALLGAKEVFKRIKKSFEKDYGKTISLSLIKS